MEQIFVRARPAKISITETYTYSGIIGDNSHWTFEQAEGEIKLVYPFDGVHDGCFGQAAREDLRKQDPQGRARQALAGRLAIVKAGKSSFKRAGLEGQTIPILLDVEHIQQKLESSREFVTQFTYRPDEPGNRPFFLREVKLTDQDPFKESPTAEYRPQYYPTPVLLMRFNMPIRGKVVDLETLSEELLKDLIQSFREGEQQIEVLPGECAVGEISNKLVKLVSSNQSGILLIGVIPEGRVNGLDEEEERTIYRRIAEAALATKIPVPVLPPVIKTLKVRKKSKNVAVILTPPGLQESYRRRQAERKKDVALASRLDESLVKELFQDGRKNLVIYEEGGPAGQAGKNNRLAYLLASLANRGEGYVLFGARVEDDDLRYFGLEYDDLVSYERMLGEALKLVNPQEGLSCQKNRLIRTRPDGSREFTLVVQVAGSASEVYATGSHCWQLEIGEKLKWEIQELAPSEVFKLFSKRYESLQQRAVVLGETPKISYGYIKWPFTINFERDRFGYRSYAVNADYVLPGTSRAQRQADRDGRRSTEPEAYLPEKYDPAQSAIEWHEAQLVYSELTDGFETTLCLEVQTPEELRDPEEKLTLDLTGQVELLLGPPVISGLEIAYFNAQGKAPVKEQLDRLVSYQTKLVLKMKLLTSDLFKMRDFSPYRLLEFEGVLPEPARYDDVEEALQDCGLRASPPWPDGPVIRNGLPRETFWRAESRTADGKFIILVVVRNRWFEINREISYGERTDKMSVPFGGMTITIYGFVEGAANKDLTALINKLQFHLKERFKFVRVG